MPSTAERRSDRLILRRLTMSDAAELVALHGDPAVMRYVSPPVPRAVTEDEFLPAMLAEYATLPAGFGCFAATDIAGAFLGWFSLRPAVSIGLDGGIELGYRLRTAAWGRGLATEGVRTMVCTAFGELGVRRLVATTMAVNTASRRVLEKAGFGYRRTFFADWPDPLPGAEHGDVVYTLDSPQ